MEIEDTEVTQRGDETMIQYDENGDEEMREIAENAGTIASSVKGTVPFCRDMGVTNPTGEDTISAEAHLESELIDQIEEWEQRASVSSVVFQSENGALKPKVVIKRNVEEY